MPRRFALLCLVCLAALPGNARALNQPAAVSAVPPNHALAIGWRSYAVTSINTGDFAQGDFTLALRFMNQYPLSYAGPIMAAENTGFLVAKDTSGATLNVEVGGTLYHFPAPVFAAAPRDWHHIALVRGGTNWFFYLDGKRQCPDTNPPNCAMVAGSGTPAGPILLGRLAPGVSMDGHEGQFYGLIDDLAVWKRALQPAEIAALAAAPRLTGQEADLFAGIWFDPNLPGVPRPAALRHGYRLVNLVKGPLEPAVPVQTLPVSGIRDSRADALQMDLLLVPVQQVPLRLPFALGETWMVLQGWQGKLSHHGRAAFALDFALATNGPLPAATRMTEGKPVFAAAAGLVMETRNDRTHCQGWPANYVMVQHAPDEVGAYLHFVTGSVAPKAGESLLAGTKLAQVSDTGNSVCNIFHLHFGLHNKPESQAGNLVTIPAAFSNYLASADRGRSWQKVTRGVPQENQWLRRCPEPGEQALPNSGC